MNNDELMHYASQYYDPVKAHEYYLKNRELKGRRSSSQLSDEGKEKWAYTKEQIKAEKTQKTDEAKSQRDSEIEELRTRAAETRARITEKLKELNAKLSTDEKTEKENIDTRTSNYIDQLRSKMKSSTLSADRKIEIQNQINQLREESAIDKENLSEETKAEKTKNQEDAADQRAQVASELKSSIEAAREAYKSAKENLDVSYEEIYQEEFDKILAENPYVKKTSSKKSSSKSDGTENKAAKSSSSSTSAEKKESVLGNVDRSSAFVRKRYKTYTTKK